MFPTLVGNRAAPNAGGQTGGAALVLYDTFTDTDGTRLGAHTMDLGGGWTEAAGGTWTISSNKLAVDANNARLATVALGASDGYVEVAVVGGWDTASNQANPGIIFRKASGNLSGFLCDLEYNQFALYELSAIGAATLRGSVSITPSSGTTYVMRAQFVGQGISCTLDGSSLIAYSSTVNQTEQVVGLRYGHAGSPPNAASWDNFIGYKL